MTKLNSHDASLLLAAIEKLNEDFDPKSLPHRVLTLARSIVPGDCTSFDFFSSESKYDKTAWTDRADVLTDENMEVFGQYVHQHELIAIALGRNDGRAIKMTDVVRQEDFERTELYNEFYRPIGFNRQVGMAMPIAADLTVSCAVTSGGKDFSERDKTILTLAAPHLMSAIRNALAYGRISSALESGGSGVIAFDSAGKTTFVSEFAERLMEIYFEGQPVGMNSLPKSLDQWIRERLAVRNKQDICSPACSLKVRRREGWLNVRFINAGSTGENVILLEEELSTVVAGCDLTRRESEILFWISKGKTNSVIATLCGISMRTVHKHVEHIYEKLGVETRTAAMSHALELL